MISLTLHHMIERRDRILEVFRLGERAVDNSVSYVVYAGETLYIFTQIFLFLLPTYTIHFYTDDQILSTTGNQSDHHPVGSPPPPLPRDYYQKRPASHKPEGKTQLGQDTSSWLTRNPHVQ